MKKLVLLDANHLMHRAYWAIQRNLSTSKGEQTNAIFGVASMLLTILNREQPDALIACWDEGSETFRHERHGEYKAGRQETPDDFYCQMPRVKQCFEAFAIPTISNPKYEADDIMGTLAVRGAETGFNVIIVSGDKDLFQMAGANIRIAVPHKGYSEPEYLGAEEVRKKLGVDPEQVPDYKGLTGDASDNLKGVKGIGPKIAASLIQTYGSMENIYAHLKEIKGGMRGKLESGRENAFFCRDMARIIKDVPIDMDIDDIAGIKADIADVERFFAKMEFYTLKARLQKSYISDSFHDGQVAMEFVTSGEQKITEDQLPLLD